MTVRDFFWSREFLYGLILGAIISLILLWFLVWAPPRGVPIRLPPVQLDFLVQV